MKIVNNLVQNTSSDERYKDPGLFLILKFLEKQVLHCQVSWNLCIWHEYYAKPKICDSKKKKNQNHDACLLILIVNFAKANESCYKKETLKCGRLWNKLINTSIQPFISHLHLVYKHFVVVVGFSFNNNNIFRTVPFSFS